ncbi:hypothetical protein OMW55_04775 [Sphingomonas sp. BN140010]|uniref:Uncharacterized protein n=1 Tax=Sphingomonas arvum TaxID=2992113 RepID=A0ABT3JDH3_9SPHN|nr:hypothetical protein [Sphingomonas sp. BN140010]MCW3797120.1 hypothetical protein [Sphingomonas sp. BN140010]
MPVLGLVTAMALAAGYPPSGSYGPPAPAPRVTPTFNPGVDRDVRQVRSDIEHGRDDGHLSPREAKALRREAARIGALQERYAAGGLSDSEQAELRTRVEALRAVTNGKRLGTIK